MSFVASVALAALLALAATSCGRLGFSAEPAPDAPLDGAPDSTTDAPCQAFLWQPVRVLDELDSNAIDWSYAWGEGMRQIVFESNRGGNFDLYITTLDDSTRRYRMPRPLTEVNTQGGEAAPSLSEDGLELFYNTPTRVMRATRPSPDVPFGAAAPLFEGLGPDLGSEDRELAYTIVGENGNISLMLRSRGANGTAVFGTPLVLDNITFPIGGGWPSLSHDGLELFLEIGDDKPIYTAVRRDRSSPFSALAPIESLGPASDPDISPDGQWMLFVTQPSNFPMLAHRTCLDGS